MSESYSVQNVLRQATAVCFDVDSTLIRDEGINRLAEACGVGEAVKEMTRTAMGGGMSFREALKARLNIIRPTLDQVKDLIEEQMSNIDVVLTPGVKKLIKLLHQRNKSVYLISGGFRRLIEPIAATVGISSQNIYCNELYFNEKGEYDGFDLEQYTCLDKGKGLVIDDIKKIHDYVVMIGDGMTDYEASPPADAFIGFGGNVERSQVKSLATWYIYEMQDLIDALLDDDSDEELPSSENSPPPQPRPLNESN